MLMQRGANPHILKNKTSDKFSRRDVQFYDLYIKKDNGEELARLRDNQYPLEIGAEAYYKDIEVEDFNELFWNPDIIKDKFGKSIKVTLDLGA
jgi:hypothetical protein